MDMHAPTLQPLPDNDEKVNCADPHQKIPDNSDQTFTKGEAVFSVLHDIQHADLYNGGIIMGCELKNLD